MCQNTQRPNLCVHNPQWHNPITQPVIGSFQSVQPGSGSVSHSQHGSSSGERGPRRSSHTPSLSRASIVSTNQRSSSALLALLLLRPVCISAVPPSLPRRGLSSLASPLPRSRLLFFCCFFFWSGQQKSIFSSLLSTVMTKLPIHLLRLVLFSAAPPPPSPKPSAITIPA